MMAIRSLTQWFAVMVVILCCAGSAWAQAPLEPENMPGNTAFYVIWRGMPAVEARKANALFALWDDPDFAPARAAMADNLVKESESKSKLSREELNEYLSLFENPLAIGYLSKPKSAARPAESERTAGEEKPPSWNGLFFVYDRTGKEELLSKAVLRARASEKDVPQISQITIAGIKALKLRRTSGVSYWVENGKYAVGTGEESVMEALLTRLTARTPVPGSLGRVETYREAKPVLGSGQVEFFAHISNAESLADESSVSGVKVAPLLRALKLDAIHSLAGHISFEGAKTRIQGALLGDASKGTLFDLWGDGQSAPASLSFVPAGAISYTSSQINFLGIYELIKRVVHATLPQTQQGNSDMVDTIAQAKLGMPVSEALGLFTGEFASMQTDPKMDSSKQIYLLGIRTKPETVKLIHSLATDNIVSEKEESGVDYLKMSLSNSATGAANIEKNSWRMAVTEEDILIGTNSETLHKAIAARSERTATGGFASTAEYSALRSKYPEKVNSLSFYNFKQVDWAGMKDRWIEESKKTATGKSTGAKTGTTTSSTADWLSQVDPKVFARHLHFASGASWKDATGIHFDEWIE